MSQTDRLEYGTGDNPNPADIPADISGRPKPNWERDYLDNRERQLEGQPWFPRATGQPGATPSRRMRAFTPDEGDFQASISPQAWDCTNVQVPQSGGQMQPVQAFPAMPGRVHVEITNTGTNPIIISPTADLALAGIGKTIAANGGVWTIDTQAPAWAYATGGPSTLEVIWTYFEAPNSHLPPKDKG